MEAEFRQRALAATAELSRIIVRRTQDVDAIKAALNEDPTWTCTLVVPNDIEGKSMVVAVVNSLVCNFSVVCLVIYLAFLFADQSPFFFSLISTIHVYTYRNKYNQNTVNEKVKN